MASRFGQFADPNFGASLRASRQGNGVLPSPGASMSASSPQSNNMVMGSDPVTAPVTMGRDPASAPMARGRDPMSNLGPGLMPHRGGGPVYLADGGEVQDSGDAVATPADPFDLITKALHYGRQAFGLPQQFFGGNKQPKSQGDAVDQAVQDEGGSQAPSGDLREFQANQMMNSLQPGESLGWGDYTTPPKQEQTMNLADGGVIPDEDSDPSDADDQGGQQQSAGTSANPQSAMAYLSGQGAVSPEVAAAIERHVDPTGQMDPSQRKFLALSSAPSPDKAFGLMQHYRQKFNGYSAMARAALQGAGGRPPNPVEAAKALNAAYAHVPDGNAMHFAPSQGGMQVTINKHAGRGSAKPKHFADGGEVDDGTDDFNDTTYETAGAQPWAGDPHSIQQQADAAQDDSADDWETRKKRRVEAQEGVINPIADKLAEKFSGTEGEREGFNQIGNAIKSAWDAGPSVGKALNDATSDQLKKVLVPFQSLYKWLAGDGQFDKSVEQGADTTIQQAAAQPGQQDQAQQYAPGMQPGAAGTHDISPPPMPKTIPQSFTDNPRGLNRNADWPTPPNPQQAAEDAMDQPTLKAAMHQIDLAYGNWSGQAREKALAKAALIANWHKDSTKIEVENLKGNFAQGRANTYASSREDIARAKARDAAELEMLKQHGREGIVRLQQSGQYERMLQQQTEANYRAALVGTGSAEKAEAAQKQHGPVVQRPMPAGGPASAPRPAQGQQVTEGQGPPPAGQPPAGMKYQVNKSGTKWRLVPAQ